MHASKTIWANSEGLSNVQLTETLQAKDRRAREGRALALLPRSGAVAVALVGIAVNALLLQRERHPAPLFGLAAPKPLSAAPAPAPAPASKARQRGKTALRQRPSSAALPPARPAEAAQSSPPASDPIAELLAGETHSDGSHLTLAAQTALAKLGYPVKPDGKEGAATEQALRDFEQAHGLPSATEITERLVKQLTAAVRAGGR